jgi:HAMP domain-containing protein
MNQAASSANNLGESSPAATRAAFPDKLPGQRIPVRTKITLPFLLVTVAMAAVLASILYQVVFENLDRRVSVQLVESGKLASEWMVREETSLLTDLRVLAFTQGVGDALREGDAKSLRAGALGTIIGNREEAVEFLDRKGNLILSIRHRPGSLYLEDYIFTALGTTNYRQWPFVDKIVAGESDARGDKFSGLARAPWGDYFYVAGPVYDGEDRLAGVILVGEGMSTLVRKMRQHIGGQTTIYDLQGKAVASTFDAPSLTSAQVAEVLGKQASGSLRRDSQDGRKLSFNTIDYGEIIGPWKIRGDQDAGLLGSAIPVNLFLQTSNAVRIQLILMVGLGLFLVLLLGNSIAGKITRPLIKLVEASKAAALGNLGLKIPLRSNDEIAELTVTFNSMLESINRSHEELLAAYDSTLEGWSRAADLRDNETERHMQNVVEMSVKLARRMGYPEEKMVHFQRGALLHDVGKIGVPDPILRKPGVLTDEERREVEKHALYAREMLSPIQYLAPALDIPTYHHERWDGTGYPEGLAGEAIPEAARIFAIVDVWDALVSDRVYRKALPKEEVISRILQKRGTHFDPRVVDCFLSMIEEN